MRKEHCSTGNFYYVSNSGNRGSDIFLDKRDYMRFVFSLGYLNTIESVGVLGNTNLYVRRMDGSVRSRGNSKHRDSVSVHPERERLVDIAAFALTPKGFHLLLKQRKDGGIPLFMQKIGTGYTAYLNIKTEQKGRVFRGPYRMDLVSRSNVDEITRFIHLQPLSLFQSSWSKKGVSNWRLAAGYLEGYPWSSYPDYAGKRSIGVIYKAFSDQRFSSSRGYRDFLMEWSPA